MKRAIITGPTGAIGNALINVLIENGVEVIAVCRANSKRVANIPNSKLVRVVECDLCNLSMLPSLIDRCTQAAKPIRLRPAPNRWLMELKLS